MAVDDDKNADEYNPEVSGVEQPEEYSGSEYTPMPEEEPVGAPVVQPGSSPAKKFLTAIVLIIAVFAVASYLMHKKKVQIAEQSQSVAVDSNVEPNISKPEQPIDVKTTENKTENKPEVAEQKTAAVETAQNKESAPATEKAEVAMPMSDKQMEQNAAKMAMAEPTPTPTSSSTPSPVKPESSAVNEAATTPDVTTPPPVSSQMSSDIDKQISVLNDQAKSNQNKLNDLNTRVTNLDSTISKLNDSITALDKKIGDMAIAAKTEKVKPQARDHKHKLVLATEKRMMTDRIDTVSDNQLGSHSKIAYMVRAIVPGRAWVESPNGYKFSVSVGDQVLGYGKVIQINADNGEVIFEGGDVIKYGPDDH